MTEIILMSDPRVEAVPVRESGEPLVDASLRKALLIDDRKHDDAGAFAHLRSGVLDRLMEAQSHLPDGLRLLFVEGYRPPGLQRFYFQAYFDGLRAAHPLLAGGPRPTGRQPLCVPSRDRPAQRRRGRRRDARRRKRP
ncbi:hypothetical protein QFZ76_000321 [Streptomyces sp. V4I2]|nr:hypothetical protein [Streptomyces sp. V4I2]